MKILLCEDDANIATIAKFSLENIGKHQVTWAKDGEEALALGLSQSYDVILLDDMMPKKSGVQVCAELCNSTNTISPVIFVSANPQDSRVQEFSKVAVGYIPKPFDPIQLNAQIDKILAQRSSKAA